MLDRRPSGPASLRAPAKPLSRYIVRATPLLRVSPGDPESSPADLMFISLRPLRLRTSPVIRAPSSRFCAKRAWNSSRFSDGLPCGYGTRRGRRSEGDALEHAMRVKDVFSIPRGASPRRHGAVASFSLISSFSNQSEPERPSTWPSAKRTWPKFLCLPGMSQRTIRAESFLSKVSPPPK